MRVLATILLSLLLLAPVSASAQQVAEIELVGPEGVAVEELRSLVALRPGERLSRRALRRSLQRLYETGRFSDVVVRSEELDEGVRLTFELLPRRQLSSLLLTGHRALGEEALRRAAGIKVGDEVTEDRRDAAERGIREAYARIGYEQARIAAYVREGREGPVLHVTVEEGVPTRLASLRLAGETADEALVARAIGLRSGDVLDLRRLEADLEALRDAYRRAGYYRARVGTPQVKRVMPGLAEITVEVDAGPQIHFAFRGQSLFSAEQLRRVLAYDGDELLDPGMVRDLAGRIERVYRLWGWPDARVLAVESQRGKKLRILFHVEEGRSLYVRELRFRGNEQIDSGELADLAERVLLAARGEEPLLGPLAAGELDAVRGKRTRHVPARIDPLRVWDEELYAQVMEALLQRYQDEGFLDAALEPPRVRIDERRRVAEVEVRVHEGRRTRIREISFPGAVRLDGQGFLDDHPEVAPGAKLSWTRLREARLALLALYAREGFLYAQAELEVERPAHDPHAARVRFRVVEGPRVKVGRLLVQGAKHTSRKVVEDALLFSEGETLRSEAVGESQARLMRLGIFRTASIRPLDPEQPEAVKDIVVELRERPRLSLEVGGGLSIADGPRAFTEATRRNLFGRNLELGVRGRVNYQVFREDVRARPFDEALERYVDLGLRYPHIYGLPIELGWRVDFIHERDIRPAYELTRWSALTGVDWPVARFLSFGILGELEAHETSRSARYEELYADLNRGDLERLRFPEGETLLVSLRPSLQLDLRDNPVSPHAGLLARTEVDFGQVLGGQTPNYVKVGATLTGYVPVGERTTLALSVAGGRIFPRGEPASTLPAKRFFLGGAGTLRGFAEDGLVPEDRREALRSEIADCRALIYPSGCTPAARFLQAGRDVPSDGGNLYGLARAELRFPLYKQLMGGLFTEAGNLWIDPDAFDAFRVRPTAGFGLRYNTPVGPVALDLGFNLDPDEALNEAPMALHFSIGLF